MTTFNKNILIRDKDQLRQRMRVQRQQYTSDREHYARDAEQLSLQLQSSRLIRHTIISSYWPLADEIDPRPFMRWFIGQGCYMCLPVVNEFKSLDYFMWDESSSLTKSSLGVMEPDKSRLQVAPEIILVPLLAFDDRGYRLGYGHGHFDRSLSRLHDLNNIIAIGLAFDLQKVEYVPHEDHDQRLDYVITPTTLYRF